jgi:hypothetical protein
METVRLIHYVSKDSHGSREGVVFTQDFDCDADDFCPPDCKVYSDQQIDMEDNGFPFETNLEKL